MWRQVTNGIPIKVYTAQAGEMSLPMGAIAVHVVATRGVRALVLGGAAALGARLVRPILRRFYGPYLGLFAVIYAAGLRRVWLHWEKTRG